MTVFRMLDRARLAVSFRKATRAIAVNHHSDLRQGQRHLPTLRQVSVQFLPERSTHEAAMSTTNYPKKVSATNPMSRRTAYKREWRATVYELLESQREIIAILKSIGNRHPNDTATQRDVAKASLEVAEQLTRLNELLGYRDAEPTAGSNGQ